MRLYRHACRIRSAVLADERYSKGPVSNISEMQDDGDLAPCPLSLYLNLCFFRCETEQAMAKYGYP